MSTLLTQLALEGLTSSDAVSLPGWWLIALPLAGAALLLLGGKATNSFGPLLATALSWGSFILGVVVLLQLLAVDPDQRSTHQILFNWIPAGSFQLSAGLQLDPLSVSFVLLITFVGSLIHVYSLGYMSHDPDKRRFFAYLNLFVAAMLLLVLADSFLLLFVGWEGVGLASYLLIGFWNHNPAYASAANKAFIVNRVGDVGLSLAIALMFATFGAVDFASVDAGVEGASTGTLTAIGLLLLLGACGKSAQFPLQSWLGDAMAGPTPVSALIHAATMVTAGVYLVVRSHAIFEGAPNAQLAVAIVGAITLIYGAIVGCAKDDIKKALAASTMSQIGYMMLAAGLGLLQGRHVLGCRLGHARHERSGRHAPLRQSLEVHEDHLDHLRAGLARHLGPATLLGLLEQGQDHRSRLRGRGLATVGLRSGRDDRRWGDGLLHVAPVLHDLPGQGALDR